MSCPQPSRLFLPFKLKANTTEVRRIPKRKGLFLPFKLKANTTVRKLETYKR